MCPSKRFPHRRNTDLRKAFSVIDTDGDGKISADDLRRFCSSSGSKHCEIEFMMSVADANGDGFVGLDEFEEVLKPWKEEWEGMGFAEEVLGVMGTGRSGLGT
ncbi:hypothetical protein QJS10_CPA16g01679 [Acorus calamus]|uniref:EF-hand domain-containing protein n=1 Tax=Acorus calamus TaxID=4465 RepID=A0AAV9D2D2_ACOCL|nr:hypothetical protein QJS10_CPA16g01679 [Acorus calamus]